jgi:hypothetical protein
VLLSHDHHTDNLDRSGHQLLPGVPLVLTTQQGAQRLGANAHGLAPWQRFALNARNGKPLCIIATPARHGPPGGDTGPVIGFALIASERPAVYVSGDTVWQEGVAEVGQRFAVALALLFMGAASRPASRPPDLRISPSWKAKQRPPRKHSLKRRSFPCTTKAGNTSPNRATKSKRGLLRWA